MIWIEFLSLCLGAYLIGNIPFGLVLCKLFGYGDIRDIGSGGIGATNVLRTGNKLLAFLTLLLDVSKGGLAVYLASYFVHDNWMLWSIGFVAILGHNYPLCLGFKGGKGVATTLGTMAVLNIWICIILCTSWLATALIGRISSLSALTAFLFLPSLSLLFGDYLTSLIAILIMLMTFWRHRANIGRLLNGAEPKISFKKSNKK